MKKSLILLFSLVIFIYCGEKEEYTVAYQRETLKTCENASNNNFNKDFYFLVDYGIHSGLKRGFLINIKNNNIEKSFLVAHGGGLGEKDGLPEGFSNNVGSNASSLGYAVINGRGYSNWGVKIKYWLEGIENSNLNLKKRVVVLHSWEGIPDDNVFPNSIVQSQGCPTVSNKTMIYIDNFIKSQENKKILILFKK